jgi:hypothetical protein
VTLKNSLFEQQRPPTLRDVKIYFNQKGMPDSEARIFYKFYQNQSWLSKNGVRISKWKKFAHYWIGTVVQNQPILFNRHVH